MPIYEFYCDSCNIIFNFFSSRINTSSRPDCPKCGRKELRRQISRFATPRHDGREEEIAGGLDESTMERAFESLMQDASSVNEDDPRQMAGLMRKFSRQTGLHLGEAMEEAISRMEAGEDPDRIEAEMGDVLATEDLNLEALHQKARALRTKPVQDEKLYRLE